MTRAVCGDVSHPWAGNGIWAPSADLLLADLLFKTRIAPILPLDESELPSWFHHRSRRRRWRAKTIHVISFGEGRFPRIPVHFGGALGVRESASTRSDRWKNSHVSLSKRRRVADQPASSRALAAFFLALPRGSSVQRVQRRDTPARPTLTMSRPATIVVDNSQPFAFVHDLPVCQTFFDGTLRLHAPAVAASGLQDVNNVPDILADGKLWRPVATVVREGRAREATLFVVPRDDTTFRKPVLGAFSAGATRTSEFAFFANLVISSFGLTRKRFVLKIFYTPGATTLPPLHVRRSLFVGRTLTDQK